MGTGMQKREARRYLEKFDLRQPNSHKKKINKKECYEFFSKIDFKKLKFIDEFHKNLLIRFIDKGESYWKIENDLKMRHDFVREKISLLCHKLCMKYAYFPKVEKDIIFHTPPISSVLYHFICNIKRKNNILICKISDLNKIKKKQWERMKGIGKKTIWEIEDLLKIIGKELE